MTEDMGRMMDFYRNALGFEMVQQGSRAYCKKDDMVLTMVGRRDYERLTCRGYGYGGGVTNHFHLRILKRPQRYRYESYSEYFAL